jgi:hypothetical protein
MRGTAVTNDEDSRTVRSMSSIGRDTNIKDAAFLSLLLLIKIFFDNPLSYEPLVPSVWLLQRCDTFLISKSSPFH